ncbi:MAG: hypothetical protein GTN78_26295, partial [Gemmatimonadales bacterium]|nr:hypothetical protein [Gemmatimonadales bacterium]
MLRAPVLPVLAVVLPVRALPGSALGAPDRETDVTGPAEARTGARYPSFSLTEEEAAAGTGRPGELMATEQEWETRVALWRDELPRHFLQPLGHVPMSGFTTTERLTVTEAEAGPFVEMPVGTKWGAKWEYGWFKGALVLPPEAAGRRILLRAEIGPESA